ncbi:hypothetical protein ACFX2I_038164 [Malus domestica]
MATGSGSLGTWYQVEQLVLHLLFLYILRTMQEHIWQMMSRLSRRVVERQFNGANVLVGYDKLQVILLGRKCGSGDGG